MIKYEVYKSEDKKPRTYIVSVNRIKTAWRYIDFTRMAKRYFKYSWKKLQALYVWVIGDELFLENPHRKGQRKRIAITVRRKGE